MKMLRDMQRLGIGIDRRADVPVRETGAAGQLSALRLNEEEVGTLLRDAKDVAWLTGQLNKLLEVKYREAVPQSEPGVHPEGAITVNAVTGPNGPFALAAAAPKPAPPYSTCGECTFDPEPAPACEAPSEQMGSGTHVCPVCEQHQPHNHSELVGKGLPMALAIGSVHSLHSVAAILGKMREDYERAAALAASVPPPAKEKANSSPKEEK